MNSDKPLVVSGECLGLESVALFCGVDSVRCIESGVVDPEELLALLLLRLAPAIKTANQMREQEKYANSPNFPGMRGEVGEGLALPDDKLLGALLLAPGLR